MDRYFKALKDTVSSEYADIFRVTDGGRKVCAVSGPDWLVLDYSTSKGPHIHSPVYFCTDKLVRKKLNTILKKSGSDTDRLHYSEFRKNNFFIVRSKPGPSFGFDPKEHELHIKKVLEEFRYYTVKYDGERYANMLDFMKMALAEDLCGSTSWDPIVLELVQEEITQ